MAHIFFEKLESRRSTQSLYGGNNIFDSLIWKPAYSAPAIQTVGYYGTQIPTPAATSSPWEASWNNGLSFPSLLNVSSPSNSSSSSWTGLPSTQQVSASKLLTPVWNFLGGLFGLQPSPWSTYLAPGGTSLNPITPGLPPIPPTVYIPPPQTSGAYYSINLPTTYTGL